MEKPDIYDVRLPSQIKMISKQTETVTESKNS